MLTLTKSDIFNTHISSILKFDRLSCLQMKKTIDRFVVGDRVVASSSANSKECLGASGSGREGIVVEYDGSDLPFRVESNGTESWYTQEHLILVSKVTIL